MIIINYRDDIYQIEYSIDVTFKIIDRFTELTNEWDGIRVISEHSWQELIILQENLQEVLTLISNNQINK